MRTSGEIVEDVLLLVQIAGVMPSFSILASAAQVGDSQDHAAIQQKLARRREIGRQADVVAAITIEPGRVLTVELCSFAPQNVNRNFGPVFGSRELANHLDAAEIRRRGFK